MKLQIVFISSFAVIALIVSATMGILVGNAFSYILFVSLISTLVFAAFGFGIYTLLDKKVPEFLAFLGGISVGKDGDHEDSYSESGSVNPNDFRDGVDGDFGLESNQNDSIERERILQSTKSGKFGDHVIIDKIPIKNEPKLMAEAIRTMMARDDE